ncbi:uncharacterized protein LOC135479039 isoform X1 [Liolophura sinensis]|uniref:uncharacterized protein LOC135479039 isoform X1 n=1 Tax=Liolophura sinensis TaxID=3198878 RepID=UPI00315835AD
MSQLHGWSPHLCASPCVIRAWILSSRRGCVSWSLFARKMATASEIPLVVVTGASGFIATHIIQQLQESGQYRVRGTLRSVQDEAKTKRLNELCPEAQYKLELVEADLTKPDSWDAAVKDATYLIHVASPFPNQIPKDENDLIQPAVEGTQSVLKACVAAKSVKRIVLTSSVAAISGGITGEEGKVYSEEDWANPEKLDAYAKSKTLAEKAAWEYIKELPDDDKVELAVINPAYVMGPVLHGSQCTSMEVVKRLMERSMPMVPKINLPVVDVRDVAAAHIKAMVNPDAAGKRHIISNTNMWMKEIAQVLSKEFKPQGYNIPTVNCPYFALWMTSLFDKTIKLILPNIGKVTRFNNSRMKDVLGINPYDAKDTLIEMAYSMIEAGFIKKSKKFTGPHKAGEEPEGQEETAKPEDEGKPKENGEATEDKSKEEDKKEGEKIEDVADLKKDEEIKKDEEPAKTDEKPAQNEAENPPEK